MACRLYTCQATSLSSSSKRLIPTFFDRRIGHFSQRLCADPRLTKAFLVATGHNVIEPRAVRVDVYDESRRSRGLGTVFDPLLGEDHPAAHHRDQLEPLLLDTYRPADPEQLGALTHHCDISCSPCCHSPPSVP